MKLSKAIKILTDYYEAEDLGASREHKAAIQLGNEALKALKAGREGRKYEFYAPLPGETKEPDETRE